MKLLILSVLVLTVHAANAQMWKCPETYPGKDAGTQPIPLTNATMAVGAAHGANRLQTGKSVNGGTDTRYSFPSKEPRWLVCWYGGKERVNGTVVGGRERGQYVADHRHEWWMELDPKVTACGVRLREIRPFGQSKSTWEVTALCEGGWWPPDVVLHP
jgi:hypothetical protein